MRIVAIPTPAARLVTTGLMFMIAMSSASQPLKAQLLYEVQDLGVPSNCIATAARAINLEGEVTGEINVAGTDYHGFRYSIWGGLIDIGVLSGYTRGGGYDINMHGTIVGWAQNLPDEPVPAVWTQAEGWRRIGSAGNLRGEAMAINDSSQIVGYFLASSGSGPHSFLYDPDSGLIDLLPNFGSSKAYDINNLGQIAGYMYSSRGWRAYRITNGNMENLGVLPGMAHSFGYAINSLGHVAGHSSSATGNVARIFRYTDSMGMQELGGVGQTNIAWGINSNGDVVGRGRPIPGVERGFIFTDQLGMRPLDSLLQDRSGQWFIDAAFDINDSGQIVGLAFSNLDLKYHAVRLNPIRPTIAEGEQNLPLRHLIVRNSPNPFNSRTKISFDLPQASPVKLEIYDLGGRKVANLLDAQLPAGRHQVTWDAAGFASGAYFYRLTAGDHSTVSRMTLLK